MTHGAMERAERAVARVAMKHHLNLPPAVRAELAEAVLHSQKAVYQLPVEQNGVRLTGRRLEVLQHCAKGRGNLEIGSRLGISEQTVKSHVQAAIKSLGARGRAHAVALAMVYGLIRDTDVVPPAQSELVA